MVICTRGPLAKPVSASSASPLPGTVHFRGKPVQSPSCSLHKRELDMLQDFEDHVLRNIDCYRHLNSLPLLRGCNFCQDATRVSQFEFRFQKCLQKPWRQKPLSIWRVGVASLERMLISALRSADTSVNASLHRLHDVPTGEGAMAYSTIFRRGDFFTYDWFDRSVTRSSGRWQASKMAIKLLLASGMLSRSTSTPSR